MPAPDDPSQFEYLVHVDGDGLTVPDVGGYEVLVHVNGSGLTVPPDGNYEVVVVNLGKCDCCSPPPPPPPCVPITPDLSAVYCVTVSGPQGTETFQLDNAGGGVYNWQGHSDHYCIDNYQPSLNCCGAVGSFSAYSSYTGTFPGCSSDNILPGCSTSDLGAYQSSQFCDCTSYPVVFTNLIDLTPFGCTDGVYSVTVNYGPCSGDPPECAQWWCAADTVNDLQCIEAPYPPQFNAGGPYASKADCLAANCSGPPWWCVSGTCTQAAAPPPGTLTGPFETKAACVADCPVAAPARLGSFTFTAVTPRTIVGTKVVLPVIRFIRCEFMGRRTELKAGCNGWLCRHDCSKGYPAAPGAFCQGCPAYAPHYTPEPSEEVRNDWLD